MQEIVVGISDVKFAKGEVQLVTYALGSCVGVCIYDDVRHVGGMLHAMLPDANKGSFDGRIEKYVNSGIPYLYKRLCAMGTDARHLIAKIVGGAKMFDFAATGAESDIGTANIVAARKCLNYLGIPIIAEATGGTVGRSVWFSVSDGSVKIKTTSNEVIDV